MKKSFLAGAFGILAIALLSTSTFQVGPYEHVLVQRLGAPSRAVDEAGLHFKWPAPVEDLERVDGRLQQLDLEGGEYLTRDLKNLKVDTFMVWAVKDPLAYWTRIGARETADARLTDLLSSASSDILSSHDFAEILSADQGGGVHTLGEEITAKIAPRALADFGIEVRAVRIKRLNFPGQNKQAVFARMQATREKVAKSIRAEGWEAAEKIKTDTDAEVRRLQAEADLTAAETLGEAEAQATSIMLEAIAKNPDFYEYLRQLEALEDGLGEDSLIILPSDHELVEVLGKKPAPAKDKPAEEDESRE